MKFILLCIVVYIQVCSAFYSRTIKNGLRIRGGRNATEYEFPYVVKIILQSLTTPIPDNTFICTGVVLSSKWTLTAGHCFTFIEENVSGLPNSGMIQTKAVIVLNCPAEYDVPQMCFAPSCDVRGVVFRAICPGDSGGPAVHASGVVSVSSISDDRDCGMKISTAVSRRDRYKVGYNVGSATPVSPFVDWISTVMRTD